MGVVEIYGIIDPRSNQLFYVGKSGRRRERERNHKAYARSNAKTICARTIRGILNAGMLPDFFTIETVAKKEWIEAEQFWIAYFKSIGCKLANHTEGGEGLFGMKHSKVSIEKTASAHRGAKRSAETRKNMSDAWTPERKTTHAEACKKRPVSQHQKDQHSKTMKGRTIPREFVAKRAAALRGRKQTEAAKINSGAGIRKSWTPERRLAQSIRMKEQRASQPSKNRF